MTYQVTIPDRTDLPSFRRTQSQSSSMGDGGGLEPFNFRKQ